MQKPQSRKSQISIFFLAIVALALLSFLAIFLFTSSSKDKAAEQTAKDLAKDADDDLIISYLQECLESSSVLSLFEFGMGQLSFQDQPTLQMEGANIPLYASKGKDTFPSIKRTEKEIEETLEANAYLRCSDTDLFEKFGYWTIFKSITAFVDLANGTTTIDISYDMSYGKGAVTYALPSFHYSLPIPIARVSQISKEIVDSRIKDPESIDLSSLLDYEMDISLFHQSPCTDIYVLLDNRTTLDGKRPFVQVFGIEQEEHYCYPKGRSSAAYVPDAFDALDANTPPILDPIPYMIANVGIPLTYQFHAEDKENNTIFYLDSGIIKNKTHPLQGRLFFIPAQEDIGLHSLNITAVDSLGGADASPFFLEVRP